MKFSEAQLEAAIIELLAEQGYPHLTGEQLVRAPTEVLIKQDLRAYLFRQYAKDDITQGEVKSIVKQLETLPASDLYESNKTFCKWLSDGFLLKRQSVAGQEHLSKKDLYIQLIDYEGVQHALQAAELAAFNQVQEVSPGYLDSNIYKIVNQLEIDSLSIESYSQKQSKRIPDGILYINGLPLVVFEFKSAIREEQASIHNAYEQLTIRYRRDIPQLFVFNALCVISDGVNNKMGTLFGKYDFYYAWRKVTGQEPIAEEGINSLHSMLQGLFDKRRLCDVMRNFIYFPDKAKDEIKVICRYPQYYAARKLFDNIKLHRKLAAGEATNNALRDGKGGTYFGATGCGKSFTMQFLSRLLMKSVEFASPTIVLITDRTDLDDQLAQQFSNAKGYIGDDHIVSVESRGQLRQLLKGRNSGGVFLTTIHKFTEDTEVLTDRCNVICISDEAHRSQLNLEQKISITDKGVSRTFGFAKYLHDSLPNATYVGFTGTPIDATLDVFGPVIDSYTMTESVKDEITVRIVYEGRAAKVILNNAKLEEIEAYYQQCEEAGSNEHQIEESKKASSNMNAKVREMIAEALKSDGVEEIFKLGDSAGENQGEIDIFDVDYMAKISKIKLPNTKIMLLQKMLAKAIDDMKKVNLAQGIDFTQRFKALLDRYNERKEDDVLVSEVLEDFSDEIISMFDDLRAEMGAHDDLGINFEEKAFYDILKSLAKKYDFAYPEDQLLELAKAVKEVVDDKAKYTDWSQRDDIKAELKVDLIILLAKFKYPPVSRDEVYKEIFTQAENFKKNRQQAS